MCAHWTGTPGHSYNCLSCLETFAQGCCRVGYFFGRGSAVGVHKEMNGVPVGFFDGFDFFRYN